MTPEKQPELPESAKDFPESARDFPESPGDFDEAWYLRVNQDVATAVATGRFPSAYAHYVLYGRQEGRRPSAGSLRPTAHRHRAEADETRDLASQKTLSADDTARHRGPNYLCPTDLSRTPIVTRRVLAVGSCFLELLKERREHPSFPAVEFIVANNISVLPEAPPRAPGEYDLLLVQVPLRSIIPDDALWHIAYSDIARHRAAFDEAKHRLALQLDSLLTWNREFGLPAFVCNFLVPQNSASGRLLPRYDLRNPTYFVEQLNVEIERLLGQYRRAYLWDIDKISASLGRRYVQDDSVTLTFHNSLLCDVAHSPETRIEPIPPMAEHYEIKWSPDFIASAWNEIAAMYRTLQQIDSVKLIVLDLDNTLWNGISGEIEAVDPDMAEGWPIGLAEALLHLKKHGILLAIASNNDDEAIQRKWNDIFHGRFNLDDFVARKINRLPKVESMKEILSEVNVLPRNVLFIDDNPVERAAMQTAFPDIRVLGRHPYYLRRILLWAPETQVPLVTEESDRRTAMVRSQIEREMLRTAVSREEFLRSLAIQMNIFTIDPSHARFPRAFELLNKTNQFNTTGRRWREEELASMLARGGKMLACEVADRLVHYGLVAVVLIEDSDIVQFVMSCRVVGLDIEQAALSIAVGDLVTAGATSVTALFVETTANLSCRSVFVQNGFSQVDLGYVLSGRAVTAPEYINVHRMEHDVPTSAPSVTGGPRHGR